MPPIGQLEAADPSGDRAREGPLLVAEQLALDEPGGQGRAVDLDERLVPAPAVRVDGPREQLLARAGLAADEHGGVGRCHAADLVQHRVQRRAPADDLVEVVDRLDLLLQVLILLLEPGFFLLGEHAIGDVHDHRPRVPPVRLRLGPPLHPERVAIVLAAELENDAGSVCSPADRREGFAGPSLCLGRRRDERHPEACRSLRRASDPRF